MLINMPIGYFQAAASAAALVPGTDYAVTDADPFIRAIPLSMRGLRFMAWTTAANGQPGLNLEVPERDLLLLLLNIQAGAAAKITAWTQT